MTMFQYLLKQNLVSHVKLGLMQPAILKKVEIYSKIHALKIQGVKQSDAIRSVMSVYKAFNHSVRYYHKLINYMEQDISK